MLSGFFFTFNFTNLFMKLTLLVLAVFLSSIVQVAVGQAAMRSAEELTKDTSGWSIVAQAISIARNKFKILPANPAKSKIAIYETQVTTRSPMGAIIYLTGGILIEDGWIRILGSGNPLLDRSLPEWNKGKTFTEYGQQPKFLLVADDAVGGFFAINGGALGNEIGNIYYLAPDDLKWEALNITYSDFINFCFVGDMKLFYGDLGWPQCRQDIIKLTGNDSFFFYPYRWSKEGKDISKDKRSIVPVSEVYIDETNAMNNRTK